jgi:RimJ/RimL family protein N-acetyltransferase
MSFQPRRLSARLAGAQSDRLLLRAPRPGDALDLFEATRHPQFNEHLMWAAPPHLDAARQRMQRTIDRAAAGVCAALAATCRTSGRWAALLRFEPRPQAGWAELGLWSHPDFWGAGHGEELTRLAIDQAFAHGELDAVLACARPQHEASLRLLGRCGLAPIGMAPRLHEAGHSVPLVEMLLTRESWARRRCGPPTGGLPRPRTEAPTLPMPLQ